MGGATEPALCSGAHTASGDDRSLTVAALMGCAILTHALKGVEGNRWTDSRPPRLKPRATHRDALDVIQGNAMTTILLDGEGLDVMMFCFLVAHKHYVYLLHMEKQVGIKYREQEGRPDGSHTCGVCEDCSFVCVKVALSARERDTSSAMRRDVWEHHELYRSDVPPVRTTTGKRYLVALRARQPTSRSVRIWRTHTQRLRAGAQALCIF